MKNLIVVAPRGTFKRSSLLSILAIPTMLLLAILGIQAMSKSSHVRNFAWEEPTTMVVIDSLMISSPEKGPMGQDVIIINEAKPNYPLVVLKDALRRPCYFSHYHFDGAHIWDSYTQKKVKGYEEATWDQEVWSKMSSKYCLVFGPELKNEALEDRERLQSQRPRDSE